MSVPVKSISHARRHTSCGGTVRYIYHSSISIPHIIKYICAHAHIISTVRPTDRSIKSRNTPYVLVLVPIVYYISCVVYGLSSNVRLSLKYIYKMRWRSGKATFDTRHQFRWCARARWGGRETAAHTNNPYICIRILYIMLICIHTYCVQFYCSWLGNQGATYVFVMKLKYRWLSKKWRKKNVDEAIGGIHSQPSVSFTNILYTYETWWMEIIRKDYNQIQSSIHLSRSPSERTKVVNG